MRIIVLQMEKHNLNIEVNLEQVGILYGLVYKEIHLNENLMNNPIIAPQERAMLRSQMVHLQSLLWQIRGIENDEHRS